MNFGKHVKRKALYCCSVSVVGLLIACLIGFAMGVGIVDVKHAVKTAVPIPKTGP